MGQYDDAILNFFFAHQTQIKMYHFQTLRWGRHKASDAYLCKFCANFDRFMEAYQGASGKVETNQLKVNLNMFKDGADGSPDAVIKHLDDFIAGLRGKLTNYINEQKNGAPEGLLAIRDEMIADAQQLIYLIRDFI